MKPAPPVTRIRIGRSLEDERPAPYHVENRRALWTKRHSFVAVAMTVCGSSGGQSSAGTTSATSRGGPRPLPGAQECEALTQAFSPVRQPWRLRLFATEDRVGGPRCRTTELGGRDRHHPALELRLLEDR